MSKILHDAPSAASLFSPLRLVGVSMPARVLYLVGLQLADREGAFPCSATDVCRDVFPTEPYGEEQITGWLTELEMAGLIAVFTYKDQPPVAFVKGWHGGLLEADEA